MNIVHLLGNLTRDPETRVTNGGTTVMNVGIALNRVYKNKDGDKVEDVTFVDLEAWAATAENFAKFFFKGDPVIIHGRLKMDRWEDKDTGAQRSKLGVVIDQFEFVPGKPRREEGGETEAAKPPGATPNPPATKTAKKATKTTTKAAGPAPDDDDDEIPF